MSQPPHPEENTLRTQHPTEQQLENITVDSGLQVVQGEGNFQLQGDGNLITLNQTRILQISVEEIESRQFIQTSPYKGLKKFEAEDKDLFFGRDQFLTGLVNELEQGNLILLLGASGSGKSSIVRAGLIPWLLQKWGSRLVHLTFTPDGDPFDSFYASLLGNYKQAEVKNAREAKVGTLTQVVTRLKQLDDYWFIFIDQFEELFTTTEPEKRDQFITSLVQLSKTKQHSIKIMATMRADFLDRLSPYPQLVKATDKHRPFITEMQWDDLRLAIEQPAAQHGVVFEEGLAEEIIRDVQGQAGYLPLLQYTLNLLWETEVKNHDIEDRRLNINTYRQLGGVRGALQQRVEQIYNDLTDEEQLSAQRIFLRLVEIGGNEESGTEWKPVRRRAIRLEFHDSLEKEVVALLINQNLLVSNHQPQSEASTIEIAHEALLTSWPRLNDWIQENRQGIALRNRLNEDMAHWQKTKADDELWSGSRLEQVLELRGNEAFNNILGGFGDRANQFIDASLGRRDRQRRRTVTRLSAFSAVTLALATFSTIQYRRAETSQITSLRQTSEASFTANRNKLDALLVGLEAAQRSKSQIWGNTDPQKQAEMKTALGNAIYWRREQNRLEGHLATVQSVRFSPDGQILATASYDNTVKLWRSDGSLIKTLKGHTEPVLSVSFSPDGQMIASGSRDGTVRLWDRNGNPIGAPIQAHKDTVFSVQFSRDGQTIITGSNDKTAKLWDKDGRWLKTLTGHSKSVRQASFSPNGNLIVTISDDHTVKLWKRDGTLQKTLPAHTDAVKSIDFSQDGKMFATASFDRTVKLWSQDGQLLKTLHHSKKVWSVRFSRNGQTIASGEADGRVNLWTWDGKRLDTWASHEGQISSLDFSPNGQILATASNDKRIKLWQMNRRWLTVLVGHEDSANSVQFSPDGKRVVSGSTDGTVKLWSTDGQLLLNPKKDKSPVYGVSLSPDGQTIASGGSEKTVILWSIKGQVLKTLKGHQDAVNQVNFSPDGQMIASVSNDETAKLWRLDGTEVRTFKGHRGRVLSVSFSPNGQQIITTGDDKTIKLWSLEGKELKTLRGHTNRVWQASFSPDGQTIASASSDQTIKLWSLDGNTIATLKGHTAGVLGLSFSPDGQMIASASSDRTIKLWRKDGTLITTLLGHQVDVNAVSFSLDGKWLASADSDGSVLLWNVSDLSLTGLLKRGCSEIRDYLKTQPNPSYNFCN